MILGDSVAEGFEEYDILNASSVAAEIGVHLDELDGQISKVKELSPGVLFLYLGMNDVTATNGDVDRFVSEYKSVLDRLREEVPDAHIFVNSIFPVQEKALEEEPLLEKIPEYNDALKELCETFQQKVKAKEDEFLQFQKDNNIQIRPLSEIQGMNQA